MGKSVNPKYVNLLQSTFEKYKSLDSPETEDGVGDVGLKEIPLDNCNGKSKTKRKRGSQEGTTSHAIKDNERKHDVSKLLKKSFEKYQNVETVQEQRKSNKSTITDKKMVKNDLKSQHNSDALVNRERKKKGTVASMGEYSSEFAGGGGVL